MAIWVVFIISLIISAIVVNNAQRLFMKLIGADTMRFNGKTKFIIIIILALILAAVVINALGIEIPNVY